MAWTHNRRQVGVLRAAAAAEGRADGPHGPPGNAAGAHPSSGLGRGPGRAAGAQAQPPHRVHRHGARAAGADLPVAVGDPLDLREAVQGRQQGRGRCHRGTHCASFLHLSIGRGKYMPMVTGE